MDKLTEQQIIERHYDHYMWLEKKGGKRAVFENIFFQSNDLSKFDFRRAKFVDCRFLEVKMPSELSKAYFKDCRLSHAHFHSNLTKTKFVGGHCVASQFTDCALIDTDFTRLHILHCNFTDSSLQKCQLIVFHRGIWEAYIGPEYTAIGCQFAPNEAWKKFTDETISTMSLSALDYWNENKKVIFMLMDSFK